MKNGRFEYECGVYWFVDDTIHRDGDLPAYEDSKGYKSWWQRDKYHRTTGPARIWADGRKQWWINDVQIDCETQEEFEHLMKLKAFW